MHIIVCIKQTPDHEGPRESYEINHDLNIVVPRGIPPVLSLFDENALEAALRIKDQRDDVKITIVSIGKRISNAVMIRALAAGADELIKMEDELFESHKLDSGATAQVMAKTVKRIGNYDLILVGRQASDWNSGYMGISLGSILNIPCITFAQKVDVQSDALIVNRVVDNGYEILTSSLPAVVMVTNELGELRYPAMKERREAKKKSIIKWNAADINLDEGKQLPKQPLVLISLKHPSIPEKACRYIEAPDPQTAGIKLIQLLVENNVLP